MKIITFLLIILSLTRISEAQECGTITQSYPNPFEINTNTYICGTSQPTIPQVIARVAEPYCTKLNRSKKCPNNPKCNTGFDCKLDLSSGNFSAIPGVSPKDSETGTEECKKQTKYNYQVTLRQIVKIECSCQCKAANLVQLSHLVAIPNNTGVLLNWKTKSEFDSQGFRIWRAIPKLNSYCGCSKNIDDYTQIHPLSKKDKPVFIPAKGNKISGSDYSYLDEEAKPGTAYCYALEDIDSKGKSKFYFEYVAFSHDNSSEEVANSNN